MYLRFWGVRGSLPVPGIGAVGVGGNTSCLEIGLPAGDVMFIDGGTGLRAGGLALQRASPRHPKPIHVLFSHFHWDHIQGVPFFAPLYDKRFSIAFYSHTTARRLARILATQMAGPYYPAGFMELPARKSFVQMPRRSLSVGGAEVSSFRLHHPQGAWGYRVEHKGRSIVYACDHEHGDPICDKGLRLAAQDADVLIYDAHFTPLEYPSHRGWGHSTWREGVHLAKQAGVKKLILFHHSPDRTDAAVERIAKEARILFPATVAAREQLMLKL